MRNANDTYTLLVVETKGEDPSVSVIVEDALGNAVYPVTDGDKVHLYTAPDPACAATRPEIGRYAVVARSGMIANSLLSDQSPQICKVATVDASWLDRRVAKDEGELVSNLVDMFYHA